MPHHRLPSLALTIVLLLSTIAAAQNQPPANSAPLKGTITSIASNKSTFTLQDRSGNQITLLLTRSTKLLLNQTDAPFIDVVVIGDRVNVDVDNNTALTITNKNRNNRLTSTQLKSTLDLSDEECEVIAPLIAQIQLNTRLLKDDGIPNSDVRTAYDALHDAIKNQTSTPYDISSRLKALRTARTKAATTLEKTTQDLISLLTPRQEATLVQLNILQ